MAVVPGAGGGMMPVAGLNGGAPRGDAPISCRSVLDDAYHLISSGQIEQGMELLMGGLSELRRGCGPDEWDTIFQAEAADHPVARLVWQDPFTAHSFRKPRGYPGDAALLDYIYGCTPIPAETSEIGQAIFQFNRERQAPRSVRARAQVLAGMIDETAALFPSPRILSVASGHLREAALSTAVAEGRIGELVALDQDAESLTQVRRDFGDKRVTAVSGSVRSILAEKVHFENMHLVYAAGLYDYLSDRVASRLTRLMFDMLAPGGRLLIANFTPDLADIGYIESFMAWKLIYRDPDQLTALARDIASSEWHSHRLFWDEHESIIFLEIVKRRRGRRIMSFGPGITSAVVPGLKRVSVSSDLIARRRHGHDGANGNGKTSGNGNRNGNGRHVEHGPEAESGA